jgi:hypothetical protein
MNHPTREEWMSYLYDEQTAEEHSDHAAHLAVCPDCKTKLDAWRSARANLDAWQLPAQRQRVSLRRPVVRWAAAAALMIGIGFGLGRFAIPATADAEKIRATIEPEIRRQLRQEFRQTLRDDLDKTASGTLAASIEQSKQLLADYAKALESKRAEESRAIYDALNKLESQRLADYVSLKKELDTVAVLTDAGLRHTEQQLVQLADSTQPAKFTNPLQK